MCGIAGFANLNNSNFFIDEKLLQSMHQCISHRGPDGFGIWKSDQLQIGLAHRRLSIIDLSNAASQPMMDYEKSVTITFNGEIYNFKELKQELESLGFRFRSNSDTEVIIQAYKAWGINCLSKFEGIFAIILADLAKNEIYLIRDRAGVKPLYFSTQNNILSFASEIKSLWHLPWIKKEINLQGLSHYLTYLSIPAPLTLYKEIYKLPASYYLKIDKNKNLEFVEWYNPVKNSHQYNLSENQYIDQIRFLLEESVKKRLVSDVPVGIFLSGGIDSSLIVSLASKYVPHIKTFNISYSDGQEYNEQEDARLVAKKFNTEHHEMVISESESFDFFEKMVYHQDEPIGDCVCIPLYYVSQMLSNTNLKVVLLGEGSDELFCGYSNYGKYLNIEKYLHYVDMFMPNFFKKGVYQAANTFFSKKFRQVDLLNNWAQKRSIFFSGAIAFPENFKKKFFKFSLNNYETDSIVNMIYPKIQQGYDSYSFLEYHIRTLKTLDPNADFLKAITYLELKHRLPELLLMRADKMTMATGVEGREPFLDTKLIELAINIPQNIKYKNGVTKNILKKACDGLIPNEIIYKKKVGFSAPTKKWFESGKLFKPFFYDLLKTKENSISQYLDIGQIHFMLEQTESKNQNFSDQLWVLQNLFACDVL
ncbi:asparagine synthase (glutamine-hydrolyzing) [Candidatus Dependentiae bacterium]|nr:asparagine synthase (glutamine-hydrolyzing) [Candidatus Dependentiae bacterium]